MKKTLRSLSLIAAFALMATIIPLLRGGGLTAYASSDFTVENGVLTAYTGDDATVTIPSTVTRIKSTAFQTSYSMTKIVIPTSVTTIDNTAFDRCSKLKEFTATNNPNFCTTDGGVLYTRDLKKIVKYPAGRTDTSYKIPSSVTTIGNSSFYKANNLTSVTVQSGVTTIEKWGFCSMSNLQTITLPDTLQTIGANAFAGDKSMTSISIPSSVTTIGSYAFHKSGLGVVTIPTSVTSMGDHAFNECKSLKTAYLSTKLNTIESYAFNGCTALTSIGIPGSIKKINERAFNGCTAAKTISMGSAVEEIGEGAFAGCTAVSYVNIPDTVTKIGKYAFSGCTAMKYISINSKAPTIMAGGDILQSCPIEAFSYIGNYTEWNASGWKYITCLNTDEVGNYLEQKVVNKVFYGFTESGTMRSIASFVTTINQNAFRTNGNMSSLSLPDALTSYDDDVFDDCTSLQSFSISENNTKYKTVNGVLYTKDGTKLIRYPIAKSSTSFTVPSGVTAIGYSAFYKNANLTSITVKSPVDTIYRFAFGYAKKLKSIDLPSSVSVVYAKAFDGLSLDKIILRSKKPSVAEDAFNTGKVTNVYYAGGTNDWSSSEWKTALDGKYTNISYGFYIADGVLLSYLNEDVTVLSGIPVSVKKISSSAFTYTTKLTSVTVPSSVTEIESSAFDPLKSLTTILVNSNNTTFKADSGVLYTIDGKTLVRYPIAKTGTAFTVPSGVTTIANSAFYSVKNLETLTLPSSLTKIEAWGINSVTKIKILTIPKSVTTVEKYAFGYLTGLNYLNIQAKNPSVVSTAFNGTANIKVLTYIGTSSEWTSSNWYAVDNIKSKTKYCNSEVNDYTIVKYNDSTATSVNLPEFATYINNGALPTTLTSVTLPKALTGYDAYLFDSCKALTAIYVQSGSTNFKSVSGVLYSYDSKTLMRYPIAKASESYSIPDGVTKIANSAFYQCKNIKHLTVPSSVTNIDNYGLATGNVLTTLNINAKNPTIASTNAFSSTTVTTVNYNGTLTEWNASNWKSVLSGKYTNLNTLPDITITKQPQSKTITEGESLTLEVQATGNGLTYEWYYKKQGATGWSLWKNRTHASETVTPNSTWNGIQLYCKITDSNGDYVTSDIATITVNAAAFAITQQPTNQYIVLGKPVTVSVKATGSGLTYQWYFKKKGQTSFSVWSGRTKASETCTPNVSWDGIQLYCIVKDGSGATKTTNTITVSVLSISTQPKSQTITEGSTLTVSLKATGSGLTYQWYFKKKTQTSFSSWNGHTNAKETCVPNATWDGIQLYCMVKDGAGNSVKSDTITITFASSELKITTQPTNQYIILGKPVTVSLKASGTGLSYQWYFKKKGQTSFSVWSGRTHASETCTPNASWDGIQLYCVVKDSSGATKTSNTITVSVLSITTHPSNVTTTAGSDVTFKVVATGSGRKYQWQYKKAGASAWSDWNGRITASTTATANATWDGMQVRCKVTDGAGNYVFSNAATITIK